MSVEVKISVDEATYFGVIVARLEVVQAGFGIVVIATVAEGVDVGNIRRCNIFGILAVDLYDLTPCIISICGCQLAGGGIGEGYYIALEVIDVIIEFVAAIRHGDTVALLVVEEA